MLIVELLMVVAFGLFVVMSLMVCVSHRSRRRTKSFTGSLVMELIWSVIPWLILVGAITPAVMGIMRDSRSPPVQARVLEPGEN